MTPKLIHITGELHPNTKSTRAQVIIDGISIYLTMNEFRLLAILARNQGKWVARDDLYGFSNTPKYIYRLKQFMWKHEPLKQWLVAEPGGQDMPGHYRIIANEIRFDNERIGELSPELKRMFE